MRNHITVLDVRVRHKTFEAGYHSLAIRQVGWVGIDIQSASNDAWNGVRTAKKSVQRLYDHLTRSVNTARYSRSIWSRQR
jgi:hypothetical protein